MTDAPFANHRDAALALLNCHSRLTKKAGQFLGQLVADPAPLSKKQSEWLEKLLVQAALPPMAKGGSE